MPLSAAVQDLPHCGRAQRGIDFFFKNSPVLTSPVQEKRDILAYFKRVEIAKDQEEQNYKSSLSNNTDDTDCSLLSSDEEVVRPGKNEKINSKENYSDSAKNCHKNFNIKEKGDPANGAKETVIDSIDLTDDAERGSEGMSVVKVYNSSGKSLQNPKGTCKSDNRKDDKTSPAVSAASLSDCEEETTKSKNEGSSESRSEESLKKGSNGGKGQGKNLSPPIDLTENKKNAFTFMMANRARQTEAGSNSTDEGDDNSQQSDDCMVINTNASHSCETPTKTPVNMKSAAPKKTSQEVKSEKKKEKDTKASDVNSSLAVKTPVNTNSAPPKKKSKEVKCEKEKEAKAADLQSSTVVKTPVQVNSAAPKKKSQEIKSEKEKAAKTTDLNSSTAGKTVKVTSAAPKKKTREVKSDKGKEKDDKVSDLNSSLQDFDLTPYDKSKRKKINQPKATIEDTTDIKPCLQEVPATSEPPKQNPEEMSSSYISFSDYMKGACSVAKEESEKQNIEKETHPVMENEGSVKKCKVSDTQQLQQTQNNGANSTKDDDECLKDVVKEKEHLNSSLDFDKVVNKRKLSCSSEKLDEKPEVQFDTNNTKAIPQSKQVKAKVKRKRARKKIVMSSDSEEDFMESKSVGMSKKKEDPKNCDNLPLVSNTTRISSFFKKMNKKEKDEEEIKVVFTVQADVHAPLDGNKKSDRKHSSPAHTELGRESGDGSSTTKKEIPKNICSTKRNAKKCKKDIQNSNLDELNRIELLEQIPPTKPLSKKVLNKVSLEGKGGEVEKMSDNTNAQVSHAVTAKGKVTVASKKGMFTRKGSLSTKKINVKNTINSGKKLLRRKKPLSVSSEEESSDELFLRRKKSEPPQSDKDVTITSSSSSSSSSTGSSVVSLEDAEEKSSSTLQSSPEASEDDKENVAHYTSQLVTRPGKLSLRLRRIHVPQQTCKKDKLKQRKASKTTELLKKAKATKNNLKKKRLRTAQKQKSPKEVANNDGVDAAETIILDDDDAADDTTKKTVPKKTPRRGKTTQILLKPFVPKSAPKAKVQKNMLLSTKRRRKSEGEVQDAAQRRTPRRAAATAKKYIEEATIDDEEDKPKKADKNSKKLVASKGGKLAPIFCKRPSSPGVELLKVVPLSPTKLKARQEFLNSTVSDDVRKQLVVEKSEDEALAWPPIPDVSHVQQREEGAAPWNLKDPEIPLKKDPTYSPSLENLTFTLDQKVVSRRKAPQREPSHVPRLELGDIVFSLSCMKLKYPDFPVYEVFKAYYELKKEAVEAYRKEIQKEQTVVNLDDEDDEENTAKRRKRKRKNKLSTVGKNKRRKLGGCKEPVEKSSQDQQEEVQSVWHERTPHVWTQMFMPKSSELVIGNTENVKKLKLWLQEWKNKPQIKPKKKKKRSSKKEDFMVSDESTLDYEEDEFVSTYLLTGPPGAGKTAAVYALANELGYKVLEVNASSRRPGRQVMSQLAEATQSHSVSNTSASSQSCSAFSALFAQKTSSSMTKKENSQTGCTSTQDKDSSKMKGVSLVLFEDIDIVFEEWDEGFMSTVNNLMSTTKRPIILTASHISPNILSQIKESFEIMRFVLPPQKLTAQHLQLAALANGCHVCLKDIECLLHLNKNDVRKSMLDLQLLCQSGSSHDVCDCIVSENTLDNHKIEDHWKEIFPEAKTFIPKKPNQVEFYKVGLWRRSDAKTHFNTFIPKSYSEYFCDKEDICWKETESNLNCVLPFPLKEREKSHPRYPLQSDDPLLKRSKLWQYESLMYSDNEEEKKVEPVTEQPEKKIKPNDPPEVQKASQSCLKSLASMYDSLAQLDILSSSQIITHAAEIQDIGWWVKQPTTGLSDNPSPSHPHWTPHSNEGIIQEIAQRTVTRCVGEVVSALDGVNAKDWPQLCLPCDRRNGTQSCVIHSSNCERVRANKRSVMSRMFDHLPAVSQVSRSVELDYLPALRNLAREDELGVALGRGRRGRRFLSHFLQLGWSVSPEDRLSLANSLIA